MTKPMQVVTMSLEYISHPLISHPMWLNSDHIPYPNPNSTLYIRKALSNMQASSFRLIYIKHASEQL